MTDAEKSNLEEMLSKAAGGDEFAWRDLVDEFSPRVFALVRSQCSDPDLAEEITQSTFVTVAAKLAEYTELGRFESWLFRIAMNRLRDEMRRRKRHAVPVESDVLTLMAGSVDPEDRGGLNDAEIFALRDALEQLSDADRQVIHLRHFGGLSFKQIAEILEQPLGTVLARQHRALQKLEGLLSDKTSKNADSEAEKQ